MKDKKIIRIKLAAERDQRLTGDAFRVLCRIGSMIYVDPKASLEKAFPLPWSKVALWCGLSDDKAASRRILELVDAGYLKCDGVRGCPPINHFYLLANCPSKGAIDCPTGGANVTPKKGAINSGAGGAHHISNSLQEEKINQKRRKNSSLRSHERVEDSTALPPAAKYLTKSQIADGLHALSQLRSDIGHKTKTGKPFEVKK